MTHKTFFDYFHSLLWYFSSKMVIFKSKSNFLDTWLYVTYDIIWFHITEWCQIMSCDHKGFRMMSDFQFRIELKNRKKFESIKNWVNQKSFATWNYPNSRISEIPKSLKTISFPDHVFKKIFGNSKISSQFKACYQCWKIFFSGFLRLVNGGRKLRKK